MLTIEALELETELGVKPWIKLKTSLLGIFISVHYPEFKG